MRKRRKPAVNSTRVRRGCAEPISIDASGFRADGTWEDAGRSDEEMEDALALTGA
jgi:hypothetical protein